MTAFNLDKSGIIYTYEVQAENADNWQCGTRKIPTIPLNPQVYGPTQQLVSLDFYENVIRHAIA